MFEWFKWFELNLLVSIVLPIAVYWTMRILCFVSWLCQLCAAGAVSASIQRTAARQAISMMKQGVERVKNKDIIKGLKCAALLKMMMMMM